MTNPVALDILLVEDNPGDARLVREIFSEGPRAHRLHHAPDGAQALAYLRHEGDFHDAPRPNLILLDLNLPGLDGRELLALIKSDDRLRRIPVVVVTMSQSEDDVRRAYDLCANGYVAKPADMGALAETLRGIESFWTGRVCLPVQ
jgi:CheY-like chemotaxis protein